LPEGIVMESWVYKQGVEKGRQETLRQSIATILTARGLRLTATRRAQLNAEARIDVLEAWLTRTATAARVADVFATD